MDNLKYKEYLRLKKGLKNEMLLNKLGFISIFLAFVCAIFAKQYEIYCFIMAIGLLVHLINPVKTKELLRLVTSELDKDPTTLTTRARTYNNISD